MPKTELDRQFAETAQHCMRALYAHRPEVFAGRIVPVSAADLGDWLEIADPAGFGGWSSICAGGVDVIRMACRHLEILEEPHVKVLAGHINNLLSAIDVPFEPSTQ